MFVVLLIAGFVLPIESVVEETIIVPCSKLMDSEGKYMYPFNGTKESSILIQSEKIVIAEYSKAKGFKTSKSVLSIDYNGINLPDCNNLSVSIFDGKEIIYNYKVSKDNPDNSGRRMIDDEKSQEPSKKPSPPRPPEHHDNPDNGLTWKILVSVCGIGVCGVGVLAAFKYIKKRRNNPGRPPQRDVEMNEFRDGQGGQQQESEENENNLETERALLTTDVQNPGEQENRHTNGGPRLPNGARCSHGDTKETDVLVDKQVQGKQSSDDQSSDNFSRREEQPNGVEYAGQKYN